MKTKVGRVRKEIYDRNKTIHTGGGVYYLAENGKRPTDRKGKNLTRANE